MQKFKKDLVQNLEVQHNEGDVKQDSKQLTSTFNGISFSVPNIVEISDKDSQSIDTINSKVTNADDIAHDMQYSQKATTNNILTIKPFSKLENKKNLRGIPVLVLYRKL